MLITTGIVVICVVLTSGISGAPVANSTNESTKESCQNVVYNVHTVQTLSQVVIVDLFILIMFL